MNSQQENNRSRILWSVITPQIIMLTISTLWILIFPADNVIKYFKFSWLFVLEGCGIGFLLSFSGYLFYMVCKKTGKFAETVELFEKVLSPSFKILKVIDFVVLSFIAGFSEEVLFRGLLCSKVGLIFSSVAFGLMHFPGKKYWIYTVWATLSGALFAWLLLTTGSIVIPITAHTVNNILGMLLLKSLKS